MNELSKTILLIEDNEDDVFVMERAFKQAGITNPVEVVTDGQQALDYFGGTGKYTDRERYPLPFIVFLDLKLSYASGFEVSAGLTNSERNSILKSPLAAHPPRIRHAVSEGTCRVVLPALRRTRLLRTIDRGRAPAWLGGMRRTESAPDAPLAAAPNFHGDSLFSAGPA